MENTHGCGFSEMTRCSLSVLLGRRLHRWREERNLPLKALAYDLEVSISTVDAWEQGTRFPSAKHLDALSVYTKIPVCGLLWPGDGDCQYFAEDGSCPVVKT